MRHGTLGTPVARVGEVPRRTLSKETSASNDYALFQWNTQVFDFHQN